VFDNVARREMNTCVNLSSLEAKAERETMGTRCASVSTEVLLDRERREMQVDLDAEAKAQV
jgi:hypothetical protein